MLLILRIHICCMINIETSFSLNILYLLPYKMEKDAFRNIFCFFVSSFF